MSNISIRSPTGCVQHKRNPTASHENSIKGILLLSGSQPAELCLTLLCLHVEGARSKPENSFLPPQVPGGQVLEWLACSYMFPQSGSSRSWHKAAAGKDCLYIHSLCVWWKFATCHACILTADSWRWFRRSEIEMEAFALRDAVAYLWSI